MPTLPSFPPTLLVHFTLHILLSMFSSITIIIVTREVQNHMYKEKCSLCLNIKEKYKSMSPPPFSTLPVPLYSTLPFHLTFLHT